MKITDVFDIKCLYNYNKRELHNNFVDFRYEQWSSIHHHDTRFASLKDAKQTHTVIAQNCIRHHMVKLLNWTGMYSW